MSFRIDFERYFNYEVRQYILVDKKPVPEPDVLKWLRWMETADRHVACDDVGNVRVSTVFLGLDHNFYAGRTIPILFETMIFGGSLDGAQDRYETWEEAEAGHAVMLSKVMNDWPDDLGEWETIKFDIKDQ